MTTVLGRVPVYGATQVSPALAAVPLLRVVTPCQLMMMVKEVRGAAGAPPCADP
jgi:hypothetical protein